MPISIEAKKKRLASIRRAADQHKHATVIERCKGYLSDFPQSAPAWSMYSDALYSVGRFRDAHKALERTISLLKNSSEFFPWLLCRKGHIFRETGDYRAQSINISKLTGKNPKRLHP